MRLFFICLGLLLTASAFAEIDEHQAEELVKASICKGDSNVADVLKRKITSRSQRDLGWRVFKEEGYYDVERAILISKGMQIRYRWRINEEGVIEPASKRAKKLCAKE